LTPERKKLDAIVIGGGLSGFSAALTLHQRGKTVAVVAQNTGASSISSGAWDFGPIQGTLSFEKHLDSMIWKDIYGNILLEKRDFLDFDQTRACLTELTRALESVTIESRFGSPYTLPTSAGFWKSTFVAQKIHTAADLKNLSGKKVGFLSSKNWRFQTENFTKKMKAESKKLGVDLNIRPLWLLKNFLGPDCPLAHVATRIHAHFEDFLSALKKTVEISSFDFILFPPIFVKEAHFREIQKTIGLPMAECLSTVEPTAGYRLYQAMMKSLEENHIPYHGIRGLEVETKGRSITKLNFRLRAEEKVASFSADQYVLASGKFFGGGIHLGFNEIRESCFKLPVFFDRACESVQFRSEIPWAERDFNEAQSWAKAGGWVDKDWKPIGNEKKPVFENLKACGSVLGGGSILLRIEWD